MPYLTPDDQPDDFAAFIIFLPVDISGELIIEFGAILSGCLLQLTRSYNFEEYGNLTPDETAAVFQTMYDLSIPWSEPP